MPSRETPPGRFGPTPRTAAPLALLLLAQATTPACGNDDAGSARSEKAPKSTAPAAAPVPPPPASLPTGLSFELTAQEMAAADALRVTLDAGRTVVPTTDNLRPWLVLMEGHADTRMIARTLVDMSHRSRGAPDLFAKVFAPYPTDAALVGARLTLRGEQHLGRKAIEQILQPLLSPGVDAKVRAAIDTHLVSLAADTAQDPSLRALAAGTIGDDERMRGACSLLLDDSDAYIVWSAMAHCDRPPVSNRLIALTRHAVIPLRARAVQALARSAPDTDRGLKLAGRYIMPLLDDPEPHVRAAAAEAIGYLGRLPGMAQLAGEPVAKLLQDAAPTPYVHTWDKPAGGIWRTGNVLLIQDRGSVSAQAREAFNQLSQGAITTNLHPGVHPDDAARAAAFAQAQAWLASQP